MKKSTYLTSSTFSLFICMKRFLKPSLLLAFLVMCFAVQVSAEGSKDIAANFGSRAYLNGSSIANAAIPFPTPGTMKVYARVGESINVGSSAQGMGNGTINFRAPNGATFTSGNSTTIGRIGSRGQEAIGPYPGVGGYTPFIHVVAPGEEGVWEIDFVAPDALSGVNPPVINALANWTQTNSFWIAAFDVSV